jgi:hypothetical protein
MSSDQPRNIQQEDKENIQFYNQELQTGNTQQHLYPPVAINYTQTHIPKPPSQNRQPYVAYQQLHIPLQSACEQQRATQYQTSHQLQQFQFGYPRQGERWEHSQSNQQRHHLSPNHRPDPDLATKAANSKIADRMPGANLQANYHQHEEALGRHDAALLVDANAAVDRGSGISLRTTMTTLVKHAHAELQDAEYRAATRERSVTDPRNTEGREVDIGEINGGIVLDAGLSRRRKAMLDEILRYDRLTDHQLLTQVNAIRANLGSYHRLRNPRYIPRRAR